jgi:hypothetical protein
MEFSKAKPLTNCWSTVFHKWWYREIACVVLGLTIMAGAITLLFRIDGMALEDCFFFLQPNNLIAVCMTVSKSALMVPITECIGHSKWLQFARLPLPLS